MVVLKKFADFAAALEVGRTAFFDIRRAEIDIAVYVFGAFANQIGKFTDARLNQRRTADGLLHANFAALHFTGERDLAFTR